MVVKLIHPKDKVKLADIGDVAHHPVGVTTVADLYVDSLGKTVDFSSIRKRQLGGFSDGQCQALVLLCPTSADEARAGARINEGGGLLPRS